MQKKEPADLSIIASHVDCMLNKAITQMMDACECLLFLNTPNSVSLTNAAQCKTFSPWLSAELETYRVIRKKSHSSNPQMMIANECNSSASGLKVTYDLRFDNVFELTPGKFVDWIRGAKDKNLSSYDALSVLYESAMLSK